MLQIETNGPQVEQKQKTGGGAPCDVPPPAEKWGQVMWADSPASH
jgi:hypothetical protein